MKLNPVFIYILLISSCSDPVQKTGTEKNDGVDSMSLKLSGIYHSLPVKTEYGAELFLYANGKYDLYSRACQQLSYSTGFWHADSIFLILNSGYPDTCMYARRFGEKIKPPQRPQITVSQDENPIRTTIPGCTPVSLNTYLYFISDTFRIDYPFLVYQNSDRDNYAGSAEKVWSVSFARQQSGVVYEYGELQLRKQMVGSRLTN